MAGANAAPSDGRTDELWGRLTTGRVKALGSGHHGQSEGWAGVSAMLTDSRGVSFSARQEWL